MGSEKEPVNNGISQNLTDMSGEGINLQGETNNNPFKSTVRVEIDFDNLSDDDFEVIACGYRPKDNRYNTK